MPEPPPADAQRMPEPTPSSPHDGPLSREAVMHRIVGGAILFLGLVVAASIFTPADSDASNSAETAAPWSAPLEASESVPFRSAVSEPDNLGMLVGPRHAVRIHAGLPVTYSVYRLDGVMVAPSLTEAELADRFPELDPNGLRGGAPTVLMLAAPEFDLAPD